MTEGRLANAKWLLLVVVLAVPVHAQSEAGSCAGIQGTVELQHAGAWHAASVGAVVFVTDHVRTGAQSRATLVFRDDSVLDVGPDTEISLEIQEFDESARHYRSLLHLTTGKVRVWASGYYSEARARYEVETATAIAAVRGTQFLVSYDRTAEISEVIDLDGQVEVSARLAVMGSGTSLGPQSFTRIAKGKFPTTPQRVDDARLAQDLEGVDLVGTGHRDGLSVLHPALAGHLLAPQDVPAAGEGPGAAAAVTPETGAGLIVPPPMPGSVADRLSPDVYTNTQPLLDYRQTTGGIRVHF